VTHGSDDLDRTGEGREILVFPTKEEMGRFVADRFRETSEKAITGQGLFSVALSGGKTPAGPYGEIARIGRGVDWKKVHVFLVDERFVPYDDERSNYGMIKKSLLDSIPIPSANVHPVATEGDPPTSAEAYESELRGFFTAGRGVPAFDMVVLGMGEDGHTASLFPGKPHSVDDGHLVRAVGPDEEGLSRVTLTLPVINRGRLVLFLVTGMAKAGTVARVVEGSDPTLPASLVRPVEGELLFLLDREAAFMLRADGSI
jgi:6-phosphogluconolactonase